MAPEKLDARQLEMIEKALPFAKKWAQMVCSDLPGLFSKEVVLTVVHYHIVDQVRLYKDKDIKLYLNGLKLRIISLAKETLCYEFFEQKRDSTKSKIEGKRTFQSVEFIPIDTLEEDQLGYTDLNIEDILMSLDQDEIIKAAFSIIDNQEKLVIFRLYYLEEPAIYIAKLMGVTGGRIGQIKKSALNKMRAYLEGGKVAC